MSNTQILEAAADWLVALRDCGDDVSVRAEFAAWLCKSPEHVSAYLELTSIWSDAAAVRSESTPQALIARARADGNVVELQDARSMRSEPMQAPPEGAAPAGSVGGRRRALFAAGLAAALLAGGAGAWWQTYRYPTYEAGVGEQRSITLADGSVVELNSRSRIRIRYSADERLIELLAGQGLFSVEKDAQRPFIVRSDDVRVRAVGTQFDVYRRAQGTVVTVLEGRVEVSADAGSPLLDVLGDAPPEDGPAQRADGRAATIELSAGEQVMAAADRIAEPRTANLAAAVAWTERQLVFDSAPLSEVAQEFNRYNARRLTIMDAQIERVLISGVFSSAEPSSLLRFLREQPDIVVEETPSEIRIFHRE